MLLCASKGYPASEHRLLFHEPDILEPNGVAVALEVDLSLFLFGAPTACSRSFVEFVIVMNDDSVVAGGDAGVLHFLPILKAGGGEFDVIGLPG